MGRSRLYLHDRCPTICQHLPRLVEDKHVGLPEMNRLDAYRAIPHPRRIALTWWCCIGGLESAAEGLSE